MKRKQRGFTLIELMVVVAIIGILALIALPVYQNYVARSQVGAGLADIRGGLSAFEEGIQAARTDPLAPTAIGLPASTAHCSSIAVSGAWSDASDQRIACTLRDLKSKRLQRHPMYLPELPPWAVAPHQA